MSIQIQDIVSIAEKIIKTNKPTLNILLTSNVIKRELMHSDILVSLIDSIIPGGESRLHKFLKMLQCPEPKIFSAVEVYRELYNIDILILYEDKNSNNIALIIENKIYAADQPKQIERYVKEMVKQGYKNDFSSIKVCYLTPSGEQASEQSIGKYKHLVFEASYDNDIICWLKDCENECCDEDIKSSIKIYREALEIMKLDSYNLKIASAEIFKNKQIDPSQILIVLDASYRYMHDQFLKKVKSEILKHDSEMGKCFKILEGNPQSDSSYELLYEINNDIYYTIGFDFSGRDYYLFTGLKSTSDMINESIRKKLQIKLKKLSIKYYDTGLYIYSQTRHSGVGGGNYNKTNTGYYSLKDWLDAGKYYVQDFIDDYYMYQKMVNEEK